MCEATGMNLHSLLGQVQRLALSVNRDGHGAKGPNLTNDWQVGSVCSMSESTEQIS